MRYSLIRLLEVGVNLSRYVGVLDNGTAAEVVLIRLPNTTQSPSKAEGTLGDQWLRRMDCMQQVVAPTYRPVLATGMQDELPFVAFPLRDGPSLAELTCAGSLTVSGIVDLAQEALEAIIACEKLGLRVGGVTLESIHRDAAGKWQVDVSGLYSPVFNAVALDSSNSHFLPPEVSCGASPLDHCNYAAEIFSLAALVGHTLIACELEQQADGARLIEAISDCISNDPSERPTASELMKRVSSWRASEAAVKSDFSGPQVSELNSDKLEPPSASDAFEATMHIEVPITAPAGTIVAGSHLGRYQVCEKLGTGGMGSVYLAEDKMDGTRVAIKVLNPQLAQGTTVLRRFAKEARIHAKANCPYVANLLEVNADATPPYLVVEYVAGGTLGELVKERKPIAQRLALTIVTDAVRGLAIAHARGVVHRDFKPDNVLLTQATREWLATQDPFSDVDSALPLPPIGRVYAKVADFGLARASQQSESLAMTREGALLGTPLYMSPEQCRGEAASFPSDVYSIGVTLYQLLSGRAPFEAETQAGLLNQHCTAPLPSLKRLRPELSDALVRTIENCLAKNADARYANAGCLLEDLENILRGQPTSLGLHPPILSRNDSSVLHFEHAWELVSGPEQLWPFISNTDRINHAIGLPAVTYTTRQDPIHGTQRFAETKVLGMQIRWQEHPYEWIEGRRFSVLREFTHGPFYWFVNVVELQPLAGGGTRVVQTLTVAPRNWLGKQVARLQLGKKSKTGFGRAYRQIDSFIAQSASARADRDPYLARTELRPGQRQKLRERLDQLRTKNLDPTVIDALGQFLEHASDLEVARIRPLAIATRFQLDADQVVNACLEGTRLGVFNLLWDIMCPSCRIPADIQETLSAIKDHGYCEACNLKYSVDLGESVELIFRIHPELREVTTATYCIGGPAWSRHVVAQVRVAAGERFACELSLPEGGYRVRGPQLPFAIELRVGYATGLSRIELSLARPPAELRKLLSVGTQVLHLCNDSNFDQQIRIERTAASHDALSAAKASTIALFRELFPTELLSADQMVSVAHITLMRIKLHGAQQLYEALGDGPAFSIIRVELDRAMSCVRDHAGAVVKTVGEGLLASFADPIDAIRAGMEINRIAANSVDDVTPSAEGGQLTTSAAIHAGTAMVATMDERLDYFGKTLQIVEKMIAASEPGTIYASAEVTNAVEIQQLIREYRLSVEVVQQLCDRSFICQQIRIPTDQNPNGTDSVSNV